MCSYGSHQVSCRARLLATKPLHSQVNEHGNCLINGSADTLNYLNNNILPVFHLTEGLNKWICIPPLYYSHNLLGWSTYLNSSLNIYYNCTQSWFNIPLNATLSKAMLWDLGGWRCSALEALRVWFRMSDSKRASRFIPICPTPTPHSMCFFPLTNNSSCLLHAINTWLSFLTARE